LLGASFVCALSAVLPVASGQDRAQPSFEVASIKPSAPASESETRIRNMVASLFPVGSLPIRGRRLEARNRTLQDLIASAYQVRRSQISGPRWLPELRFDIEALLPANTARSQANELLQHLLEERFGLVLHRETRDIQGYVLTTGKGGPKLKPSAPAPLSPDADGADPKTAMLARTREAMQSATRSRTAGPRVDRYTGFTTTRFARALESLLDAPVVDRTELAGEYDFVLDLSSDSQDLGQQPDIARAVRDLGLKLEPAKMPLEHLVIERISKTPTAN